VGRKMIIFPLGGGRDSSGWKKEKKKKGEKFASCF
jgi:hypothetical protein